LTCDNKQKNQATLVSTVSSQLMIFFYDETATLLKSTRQKPVRLPFISPQDQLSNFFPPLKQQQQQQTNKQKTFMMSMEEAAMVYLSVNKDFLKKCSIVVLLRKFVLSFPELSPQ
jgi:hypothetical protein